MCIRDRYCTRDATPISKAEVAMDNSYQQDTDPSIYAYFKLADSDEFLLAWTTTPWTLPANVAVAVKGDLEYSLLEHCLLYTSDASDQRSSVDLGGRRII